jgi:hypothetical protein
MTKLRHGRPSNRDLILSQTVSEAHLAPGLMGTHSSFPGIKRPRRYVHHSPHLALKLRICGAHMPSWIVKRQLYLCTIDCVINLASRRPPLTDGKGSRERSYLLQGSDKTWGNINTSVSTSPEQGLNVRSSEWVIDWFAIVFEILRFRCTLGLSWRALCAPYQFMGAPLLWWSSRWPQNLYSSCALAPRRSPDTHVCVKPKLHIHKECGPRLLPLLHISYTVDWQPY